MDRQVKYDCVKILKESGNPVIIVAAVHESEAILNACKEKGIQVAGFCDSIKEKSQKKFCGLEVIHTPSLPDRFSKARFIIASQHIQDCLEQLTGLGYDEFYSPLELIEDYNLDKYDYLISKSYMEARLAVCKNSHKMYFQNKEKIYMRSIDIMITERCSLKCESCCNLMQYYKEPKNTDKISILDSLKIISDNVDEISEFRIIGGEPLMNRGWSVIVKNIAERYPGRQIFIYTNGTIAPKDDKLESLKNKNVNFVITDYGHLSRNIKSLESQLDKFNLNYVSTPAEHWVDCSSIRHHKRSTSDLKEVFKQCCVKYIYTLLNGKLYRCPFIANAANLNAIPDNPANYVDLFSKSLNIKDQIKRLVKVAKFFPGCDFCDGRPYDGTNSKGYDGKGMIKAGIQTPTILDYKEYK